MFVSSSRLVYHRDGSAPTFGRAAILKEKLQIKLSHPVTVY